MSSLYRLGCIPAAGVTLWFAHECVDAYTKIHVIAKYVAHRQGYQFKEYPKDDAVAAYAPPLAALLAGVLTYHGSRSLMDRILLAAKPDTSKLFDKLSPADYARVRLSPQRLWKLIGPTTASRGSWRELSRVHGLSMTSATLALLWAVCVSPVVQTKVECLFAPKGPAMTDASRPKLGEEESKRKKSASKALA
jgi:hypothetical protein